MSQTTENVGSLRTRFALQTNNRLFYGWTIVAISAMGIFASGPGQSHIFSVYYPYITKELGLTYFEVTAAYTLATLIASFALPFVGRLVDKSGPRRVVLLIGVLFGLAVLAFSYVTGLVVLGLAFAALRFLGQGSLMLCCNNMVSQWFNVRRGFALSMLSWGFAISMAIHPILAEWLSANWGWRQSWIVLAISTWVLILPFMWFFAHDKPEKLGLRPDGEISTEESDADSALVGMSLAEARQTPTFWVITISLMSLAGLVTALFLNQVTIFNDNGLKTIGSISVGTYMFFITAITMVIFVPIFGKLLDRFQPEKIFTGALLLMSLALIMITFVTNIYLAIVYAIVFGLANASIHAHYVYLWAYYFGRKHLGSIQGFGQSLAVVGASILPLPFAWVYDEFGSFSLAMWLGALIPGACALFSWNMKRPVLS